MKNTRIKFISIISIFLVILGGCGYKETKSNPYIVLIGEESSIIDKISNVDLLIIDADYFTSDEIETLKNNNVKEIYSYLNIGSIEDFRSYYDEYSAFTLGEYENWDEEKWIDVSNKEWQEFISKRVDELSQKGIDGFFIDNTDVFYVYPSDEIYQGIIDILSEVKKTNKGVIINGGDCFVKKYIETGNEIKLFDGVNQEGVYTQYDFSKQKCKLNDQENRDYYTDYLDMVLLNGYRVYVLEYATNSGIKDKAYSNSNSHNYICYVSNNIELRYCN